jgi:hypothetical protein
MSLTIRTNSKRVYSTLTKELLKLEKQGFTNMPEGEVVKAAVAALRQ